VTADEDDELFEELAAVLRRSDPVPEEVSDFARSALAWRRLDAELAELLEDTALETEAASLARGGAERIMTFRATDLTIDMAVHAGFLLGQLAPQASATVDLQTGDATVTSTTQTDALGRFRFDLETEGRFRLRIVRREPEGRAVETSWFTV
jgi:hypothetical protein